MIEETPRVLIPGTDTDPGKLLKVSRTPGHFQELKSGLFAPDNKIILLPKKEIPKEIIEVLTPSPKDVQQLAVTSNNRESGKKDNEKLLFFISRPWDYCNNKLDEAGVQSPIPEITDSIEKVRTSVPISETSRLLLKSPLKHIREAEKKKLNLSDYEYQIACAPNIALVDVQSLNFIHEKNSEDETIQDYYSFLNSVINELFYIPDGSTEQLKHLAHVSQYLDVLSQSFLYKFGQNKLDNGMILETIAERMEPILQSGAHYPKEYLQIIFNFLSYFEMNNSVASTLFSQILTANSISHPIIHELNYQLHPEKRSDPSAPNIGMEIEGIPTVVFGNIPDGFELGIDGAGTIPEFRRSKKSISFDAAFKKDLYDLWYFAKMSQLKGASLHVHIDLRTDLLKEDMLNRFKLLFGFDSQNVKFSQKNNTVEIRFNLAAYKDQGSKTQLDISSPFFHDQYDLVGFIETLLDYSSTGETPTLSDDIPNYWKLKLSEKKHSDYDSVLNALNEHVAYRNATKDSPWTRTTVPITEALRKFSGTISYDQLLHLLSKTDGESELAIQAFAKLEEPLTFDQVSSLVIQYQSDTISYEAFKRLEGSITATQAINLYTESNQSTSSIHGAVTAINGSLSLQEIDVLMTTVAYKNDVHKSYIHRKLMEKSSDILSAKDVIDKVTEYKNDLQIVTAHTAHLKPVENWDTLITLISNDTILSSTRALTNIFDKLTFSLSYEEVIKIGELCNWTTPFAIAVSKMDTMLTPNQFSTLLESARWDSTRLVLLKQFDGVLSFDEAYFIATRSHIHNKIESTSLLTAALEKVTEKRTTPQLLQLLNNLTSITVDDNTASAIFSNLEPISLKYALSVADSIRQYFEQINIKDLTALYILTAKLISHATDITDDTIDEVLEKLKKLPKEVRWTVWTNLLKNDLNKPVSLSSYI